MKPTFDELARWYAECDPDGPAIDPGDVKDHRYVPFDAWPNPVAPDRTLALRGPSAADHLVRDIRLRSQGPRPASAQLFSGFRGSGKSTELARVKAKLDDDYTVLSFRADTYHHLSDALTPEELGLLLVAGIGEAAEDLLKRPVGESTIWERIRAFLGQEVELTELKLGGGGLEVKALLKGGQDFKNDLAKLLRNKPDRLRAFVHGFVHEVVAASPRPLVVLVDGLEKYYAPTDRIPELYQAVADLFFHHAELLKLPDCHVVYTVPPYLAFLNKGVADRYCGRIRVLASVLSQGRPPSREPQEPGLLALEDVLTPRVNLDRLFLPGERERCVRAIAVASGGHVRDLLHIAREVIAAVTDAPEAANMGLVQRAIDLLAQSRGVIFVRMRRILARIAEQGTLDALESKDLLELTRAMDQYMVLHYYDDSPFYDVHPLVRERVLGAEAP